jgi:hypothetical protein
MHYVIGRFKHYGKDSNQSVIKYSDMDVDRHKSREELTDELRTLRQETARVKRHLVEMARQHRLLRRQLDEHCREVEDFLRGRIMFRDLVYREDSERTLSTPASPKVLELKTTSPW